MSEEEIKEEFKKTVWKEKRMEEIISRLTSERITVIKEEKKRKREDWQEGYRKGLEAFFDKKWVELDEKTASGTRFHEEEFPILKDKSGEFREGFTEAINDVLDEVEKRSEETT